MAETMPTRVMELEALPHDFTGDAEIGHRRNCLLVLIAVFAFQQHPGRQEMTAELAQYDRELMSSIGGRLPLTAKRHLGAVCAKS